MSKQHVHFDQNQVEAVLATAMARWQAALDGPPAEASAARMVMAMLPAFYRAYVEELNRGIDGNTIRDSLTLVVINVIEGFLDNTANSKGDRAEREWKVRDIVGDVYVSLIREDKSDVFHEVHSVKGGTA